MKYLCSRQTSQAHAYPSIWLQTLLKILKILKIYAIKYLHIKLHMSLNEI